MASGQWPAKKEEYMAVQHYRELLVWQKAMDLVEAVYRATSCFPNTKIYGLTSQLRRAAVSIPSNIAEGQGRNTTRDFLHYLSVALGSLFEVETQISIAGRLDYVESEVEMKLLESAAEVGRLLNGLCNALNKKLTTGHWPPTTSH